MDSLKNTLNYIRKEYQDIDSKINNTFFLLIHISEQMLYLVHKETVVKRYPISTAQNGVGNLKNSYQTPIGFFTICEKIGENEEINTIFVGRKSTNTKAIIKTSSVATNQDCITSRILWLDGYEEGKNKLGNVDTRSRFIYIHGTHEEGLIGTPVSHGCIRMKNQDVIELFNAVDLKTFVYIIEK